MTRRTGIVIQARSGSSRLPGKVLRSIGDSSLLDRLVRRMQAVTNVAEIVVATGSRPENRPIVELCQRASIDCFVGSEENCLERMVTAAQHHHLDLVVRVTADNPLTDPHGIAESVEIAEDADLDYFDNICHSGYPHGAGFEIISTRALEFSLQTWQMPENLEHVTWAIRRHLDLFRSDFFRAPAQLHRPDYRLSVDYEEDFTVVSAVYEHFDWRNDVALADIIGFLDQHPELVKHNSALGAHLMTAAELKAWQLPIDLATRQAWQALVQTVG